MMQWKPCVVRKRIDAFGRQGVAIGETKREGESGNCREPRTTHMSYSERKPPSKFIESMIANPVRVAPPKKTNATAIDFPYHTKTRFCTL